MSTPTSATLFWLAPRNVVATRCVQDESNSDSVGAIPNSNGQRAIVIAFDKDVRLPGSLLTLGGDGDVELRGHKISRNQLQVQLHSKTLEILIRDTSTYRNTKIISTTDPESLYFSTAEDMPRQVVIRHGESILLSTGGENKDLAQFEVIWPLRDTKTNDEMRTLKQNFVARGKSRFSVTPYETPSHASRYESRVQSPNTTNPWLHRKLNILGAGTFGEVYKTINMHTGEYFAVKVVRRSPEYTSETDWRKAVRSEVKILETLCHPNIVEYYHSQGFKTGPHPIEIFMALYDGSVEDLVMQESRYRRNSAFLVNVYSQVLKALTYLANKGLIHRDVKPANILFMQSSRSLPVLEQSYRFVLADFGLSKEQMQARTLGKGSLLFMAPEMYSFGAQQSHKVDVYSLGVTMLAIDDAGGIISNPVTSSSQIQNRLQEALQEKRVRHIGPHLLQNPDQRPSAQQIFLHHWPMDEEAQRLTPQESPARAENPRSQPRGENCDLRWRRHRVTKRNPRLMNRNAGGELRRTSETAKLFQAIVERRPQCAFEDA